LQLSNDSVRQERHELVDAICTMSHESNVPHARVFLEALSGDELRYIAGYLGARVLDPELAADSEENTGNVVAGYTAQTPNPPLDSTHKMLLLRDYLRLSGMTTTQVAGA
jgi:hypothetical protein